jgi:hypothetical protein
VRTAFAGLCGESRLVGSLCHSSRSLAIIQAMPNMLSLLAYRCCAWLQIPKVHFSFQSAEVCRNFFCSVKRYGLPQTFGKPLDPCRSGAKAWTEGTTDGHLWQTSMRSAENLAAGQQTFDKASGGFLRSSRYVGFDEPLDESTSRVGRRLQTCCHCHECSPRP